MRGFDSSLCISLPDVFTRNIITANRLHIPTLEVATLRANCRSFNGVESMSDKRLISDWIHLSSVFKFHEN